MEGTGDGQLDRDVEERRDLPDEGVDVVPVPNDDGSVSTRCTAGSTTSGLSSEPPGPGVMAGDGGRPLRRLCRLCRRERGEAEERLFSSPCLCRSTLVHRSCVQERLKRGPEGAVCPWCQEEYPVRTLCKPLWKWFWEKETRAVAALFVANLFFSVGDVGVLSMAWMYALFEFPPTPWQPAAALTSTLFVFSMLWLAFRCFRYHVFHELLENWRSINTTREVLLDGDGVEQA